MEIYDLNIKQLDINGSVYVFPPNDNEGYNCGFALFIPDKCKSETSLMVNCCNTGHSCDSLEQANEKVKESAVSFNYQKWIASDLRIPSLIPLFPRINGFYTHQLGSKVYNNDFSDLDKKYSKEEIDKIKKQCTDIPNQLSNMIVKSKEVLNEFFKINVSKKVIIEGYSAGSKFAMGFTALHPEQVDMCIAGGTGGLNILPVNNLNGIDLKYPLGVSDIPNFNYDEFKEVDKLVYIGDMDNNDPAAYKQDENGNIESMYKDCYTDEEVKKVNNMLGTNIQERFDKNKFIYNELGMNSEFIKFSGNHTSILEPNEYFQIPVKDYIEGKIYNKLLLNNKDNTEIKTMGYIKVGILTTLTIIASVCIILLGMLLM